MITRGLWIRIIPMQILLYNDVSLSIFMPAGQQAKADEKI